MTSRKATDARGRLGAAIAYAEQHLAEKQAIYGGGGYSAGFAAVVAILIWRLERLLAREARLGSGLRLKAGGRIGDAELRARVQRLGVELEAIREAAAAATEPDADVAAQDVARARRELDLMESGALDGAHAELALSLCWEHLDAAHARIAGAFERAAVAIDPGLRLATLGEIEALADGANADGLDVTGLLRLAALCEVADDVQAALAEARALYVGRFARTGRRGRPEQERGRRLAAHLLGLAEALGLARFDSRGSAVDAVIAALEHCDRAGNAAAHAILAEVPRSRDVIERRLLRDLPRDPILAAAYADGQRIAAHLLPEG